MMLSERKSKNGFNGAPDKLWSPGPVKGITLFKARSLDGEQPRHSHNSYFVGVIEKGARRISLSDETITATTGRLITLNPLKVHSCQTVGRIGCRYRAMYLDPGFVRDTFGVDLKSQSLPSFQQPLNEDAYLTNHLSDLLGRIDKEPAGPGSVGNDLMEAIIRIFNRHASRDGRAAHGDGPAVARSLEYIRAKAHHDITVDDLAAHQGLSKYHFIRVFKATTGLSPHAYLVQRRLEISKQAIEQGLPLADAAAEAGFADQSHMTRWFKAVYCVTPGAYQRGFRVKPRSSRR